MKGFKRKLLAFIICAMMLFTMLASSLAATEKINYLELLGLEKSEVVKLIGKPSKTQTPKKPLYYGMPISIYLTASKDYQQTAENLADYVDPNTALSITTCTYKWGNAYYLKAEDDLQYLLALEIKKASAPIDLDGFQIAKTYEVNSSFMYSVEGVQASETSFIYSVNEDTPVYATVIFDKKTHKVKSFIAELDYLASKHTDD